MSRTELITTGARLDEIVPAWRELYDACPGATPFQSPAWLRPWWDVFGAGTLVTLYTTDDAGRPLGLAPLYVYRDGASRRLFLLGSGNTDYLDVLIRPGCATEVRAAWWPALKRLAGGVDEVEFQQLSPDGAWRAWPPAFGRLTAQDACPYLAYDEALGGRPVFKAAAYEWRRAQRQGRVQIERADAGSAGAHLASLTTFHTARWRERGEAGVLNDPRARDFLGRALPGLAREGALYLTSLRFDDLRVATLLGFTRGTRAYLYLTGFDPTAAKLSPSKLLMWQMITDTRAAGATGLDLLRGQEAYKYRWGAVDRWNQRWTYRTQRPAPEVVTTGSDAIAEPLSNELGW